MQFFRLVGTQITTFSHQNMESTWKTSNSNSEMGYFPHFCLLNSEMKFPKICALTKERKYLQILIVWMNQLAARAATDSPAQREAERDRKKKFDKIYRIQFLLLTCVCIV